MIRHALLAFGVVLAGSAIAQTAKPPANAEARRQEDITQHRRLAQVHEAAARCLESGKSEKECHEQLAKDCKGAGIGKFCGMRHTH